MDNPNGLIQVKGKWIEPKLLEHRETERCFIPDCQAWCCTGGVWVDLGEKEKILANAERIKPFLPADRHDESKWFDGEVEPDSDYPSGWGEGTTVIDDATHPAGTTCIFLRPEDRYCAIQSASMAGGEHPWSLKPYYCVLHPLTIEDDLIQLDDTNTIYIEGGHCQRPHTTGTPLFETFKSELVFALGEDGYDSLQQAAQDANG